MNGYFGKERLPDPSYNWNAWADPLASKEVFSVSVKQPLGYSSGGHGYADH